MNSYRANKQTFRAAFIAAVLLSIAVFAIDTAAGGFLRSYIRTMASLALTMSAGVTTSVDGGYFTSHRALQDEITRLNGELSLRDEEHVLYRAMQAEIEHLGAMARLAQAEGPGITARVLSSFSTSPYGTFLINAGLSDGLQNGNVVLTPGGFVLGTITDIDAHSASVQSLFAPTYRIDLISGDIAFSADGRGGGNALAEVPRDAALAVGDVVAVPQFGGRPAGIIGGIESASSSATQALYIGIPVNLETLSFVYVIPHK